jgi:hypothetical protein
MRIEPVLEELPAEFDILRAEARAEGHRFLDRLANDWGSGALRFNQPGEALSAAYASDMLAGFGRTDRRSGRTWCASYAACTTAIPALGNWSIYGGNAVGQSI